MRKYMGKQAGELDPKDEKRPTIFHVCSISKKRLGRHCAIFMMLQGRIQPLDRRSITPWMEKKSSIFWTP